MSKAPFSIQIAQEELETLRARLTQNRWPDTVQGADWDYGTDLSYLKELVAYWARRFDWRAQERAINQLPHYRVDVNGFGLHFIHVRGRGPRPLPLLLSHGFPDSFLRMQKLIPLLTEPAQHGAAPEDAFDVVVPSLPGFGFSDRPSSRGFGTARIAELFGTLMSEVLGYARYAAHGGDWGSTITEQLARQRRQALIGIHLTDIPFGHLFSVPRDALTPEEKDYLKRGQAWSQSEGAYALIQSTKPQTLAFGLNDSPVGLAAWIVEKFRSWSDCGGDVERCFSKDELLTNITLYWLTQTIHSACRIYFEASHSTPSENTRVEVPTGVALFPKDIINAPRRYAERFFDVQRWTEMPRGGHFAALEQPELLAQDLRAFFRPLRS